MRLSIESATLISTQPKRHVLRIGDDDSGYFVEAREIKDASEREYAESLLEEKYTELGNGARFGGRRMPNLCGPLPFARWCWYTIVVSYCLPTEQSVAAGDPNRGVRKFAEQKHDETSEKHFERFAAHPDAEAALVAFFRKCCRLDRESVEEVEEELGNSSTGASHSSQSETTAAPVSDPTPTA
jgi:hypothetical protein